MQLGNLNFLMETIKRVLLSKNRHYLPMLWDVFVVCGWHRTSVYVQHKPLLSMHSFRKHRRRSVGFVFPVHALAFSGLLLLLEQNTPLIWCPEPQVLEHLLQELTYQYIKSKYALNFSLIFFSYSRYHFRVPVTNFCVTCRARTLLLLLLLLLLFLSLLGMLLE